MTKYLSVSKVVLVMIVYSIVTIIGICHHELFLDEAQHFLIARDSNSIKELSQNIRYDGHVMLWNILLFYLTHYISANVVAMQVFHLIIINTAVFIFLRYAPFNLLAKTLIVFGFYFIFVYSLLSRNYALGLLLLFIVCKLISNPDKNIITIGVLLVLMCNIHFFYVFISAGIFLYLLYDSIERKKVNSRFLIFTLLFFAGIISATLQTLRIPTDNNFFHPGLSSLNISNISFAIHGLDKGYFPFPPLNDPNFWDRYLFEGFSRIVKVFLSLLFLVYPVFVIRSSRKALIFYISSSFLLLIFLTVTHLGGSRYFGMFFIFFIASVWMADYDAANNLLLVKDTKTSLTKAISLMVFYIVLACQFAAGAYTFSEDYYRPFSQSKATAKYIQDEHLEGLPLVVDGYNSGPPLSAYLGKKLYYLGINQMGSFCYWKKSFFPPQRAPLMTAISGSKYLSTLNEFILITNRPNYNKEINNSATFHFYKLRNFDNAIISSENYYLFRAVKSINTAR